MSKTLDLSNQQLFRLHRLLLTISQQTTSQLQTLFAIRGDRLEERAQQIRNELQIIHQAIIETESVHDHVSDTLDQLGDDRILTAEQVQNAIMAAHAALDTIKFD